MGVLHTVLPLNASCAEWLDQEGVTHPAPVATFRLPTPSEITSVLRHLQGYSFEISADSSSGEWSAHIAANPPSEAWAFLRISDFSSDHQPHEIYFPKGWPEVIFVVVERLSHHCGPLIVVDDSTVRPIVVRPDDSLEDLVRRYEIVQTERAE
jgi:hypothetical protein